MRQYFSYRKEVRVGRYRYLNIYLTQIQRLIYGGDADMSFPQKHLALL